MGVINDYGGDTPAADRRFYSTRRARQQVQAAERPRARKRARAQPTVYVEPHPDFDRFHEPYAGTPLHWVSGAPTRVEGESHLEAWKRTLRCDPCAYCGRAMRTGAEDEPDAATVDHIVPRSKGERHRERWSNFTGACLSCNGSKSHHDLLLWMRQRSRLPTGPQPRRYRPN